MRTTLAIAATVTASMALSGCASLPRYFAWLHPKRPEVSVQPVETATREPMARDTQPRDTAEDATGRLYRAAVVAIDTRDYGRSLDLLQLARERSPRDVRVLNALGVTYDKLGRFDLSARFYAQAAAEAPDSPVVMANIAYSKVIQHQFAAEQAQAAVAPPVSAPQPPLLRVAEASAPAVVRGTRPRLVGRPLLVINSGGDGETVRRELALRGWSMTRSLQQSARLAESRIIFPREHRVVALALANTLPFHAALIACETDCHGVKLILGENAQWHG